MADTRTLTLAHPLSAPQAERLRASNVKDYRVGDKITVPLAEARSIIDAGYAEGIEPENAEAVQAVMDGKAAPPSGTKNS